MGLCLRHATAINYGENIIIILINHSYENILKLIFTKIELDIWIIITDK